MPRNAESRTCKIPDCTSPHYAKGWCSHHYHTDRKYGTPDFPAQRRERSCGSIAPGTMCCVAGCGKVTIAKGLCRKHYARQRAHGDPSVVRRGPNGSGSVKRGYVYQTRNGKKGLAHRLIMEGCLGRGLLPHETVHHKNGQRSDNRLVKGHELHCPGTCCNLELWSKSQPSGQRVQDKLAWAQEIIRVYAHEDRDHGA